MNRQISRKQRKHRQTMSVSKRLPDIYMAKPRVNRKFRFSTATMTGTDVPITGRCLLNLVLSVLSGNTVAVNVIECIRVTRVKMYCSSDITDTNQSIALMWRGDRAPDIKESASGTSAIPAYLSMEPPKDSLAGFWVTNLGNIDSEIFSVTYIAGTLIDVSVEYIMGDGATRTVTVTAPSFSGIGYGCLDNALPAGTVGSLDLKPLQLTEVVINTP